MSGLGAVFKTAMDGGAGLLDLDPDEDDEFITELEVILPERVDGVSGPANGAPTLMLKALGSRAAAPLPTRVVKTEGDKRVSVHLAYPSMRADQTRAMDGFRDFAGPDAVQDAAWHFMKQGAKIGLGHQQGTTGAGTCVESWVHRADPWTITAVDGTTQTIMPGDWLIAVQWPADTWELVKSGVINGVSMQGTATRRKPSPEALAALRKSKGGKKKRALEKAVAAAHQARRDAVARQVDRALAEILAEQFAEVRKQAADLNERVMYLGRQRGFAWAEQPTGGLIKGEGLSVDAIEVRVRKARKRAQKAGVGRKQCPSCGRWSKSASANPSMHRWCSKCGASLAKSETAAGAEKHELGVPAAPVLTGAEEMRLAAIVRKARSGDSDERLAGIGELVEKLGTEVAVKIIGGDLVSPEQFTRAYLSQRRAPLSAPAGATPRIPETTHTVSNEDFTRPPLEPGHQRPSQVLDRLNSLMQPGQAAYYRASPGIASASPYDPAAGAPSGSTVSPALARAQAAQGAFSRPPMPGDTRP